MAFSSGTFSLYTPGNPVVTGTTISISWANNTLNDIATGLSTCLLKDGSQTVTANIPFSGFKLTGIGAATTNGDAVRWQQSAAGVLTTTGDTLYASSANVPARLAIGTAYQGLITNSGATAPSWASSLQSLMTTTGDTVEASAANTPARMAAAATVAAHATTCDPWVARVVTLSGGAVTFTDIADADYVGQRVLILMNAAHVWTDGAVFDVQGGATYTTAAGDWVELVATAVDAFDVTIFPANGGLVAIKGRTPITVGTMQATTSGTSFAYTSLPTGIKRITINFVGVSLSGTDNLLVQIGDTNGVSSSGYVSSSGGMTNAAATAVVSSTAGFIIISGNSGNTFSGSMTLNLVDAATFQWSASHSGKVTTTAVAAGGGDKALAATLDRLTILATGSDTFDAGAVNISYE